MHMLHHRQTIFPAILGLATIGLIVLVAVYTKSAEDNTAIVSNPAPEVNYTVPEKVPVSAADYENQTRFVLEPFFKQVDQLSGAERENVIDKALNSLLAEQVPVEYRDLHLALVRNLHNLKNQDNEEESQIAYKELLRLRAETPWLP